MNLHKILRYLAFCVVTLLFSGMFTVGATYETFTAHLSGSETLAQGEAIFRVNDDGNLHYRVLVANIEGVLFSQIHCAPDGINGPVGIPLFHYETTDSVEPVSVNGILAEGAITNPLNIDSCGWSELSDVVEAMQSGNAYVYVHTVDQLSGEIHGQIKG